MKRSLPLILAMLLWSCTSGAARPRLAALPEGCTKPGEIVRATLPHPKRGYTYYYQVYLPPCFSADSGARYPILYLVPGRSSLPDTWFAAGLTEVIDKMIVSSAMPPLIVVATENTDSDPMAETISKELIPVVESQYPVMDDRRYRAAAGGSLGGIAAYRLAFQYPDEFSSAGMFGAGAISGEEPRIKDWLSAMTDANRTRVFMDTGAEDILMLQRAQVMKTMLDEAGVENELHVGQGGHNYSYWVSEFETYLKWVTKDW